MERRPRRWWLRLEVLVAALIVLAAAISALFQLLVASLPEYRQAAEQRLSAAVGTPVSMSALRLAWHDFEPVLVFDGLRVAPAQGAPLSLAHLRVGLDPSRLLLGQLRVRTLTAVGLHIDLTRDSAGQLHGPDLGSGSKASGDLDAFLRTLHAVQCEHCRVELHDEILHARYDFGLPRLRLQRAGDDTRLRFTLLPPSTLGGEVRGRLSIRGELQHPSRWSGSFTLHADRLRSLPWLDHRLRSGSAVGFADASLTLHGRLDHGWPTQVEARFAADTIAARRHGKPLATLHRIDLVANLGGDAAGWHLRLDPLRLSGAQGAWPESRDSLQWLPDASGGYTLAADIDFLRLGDLLPLLALWPQPPPVLKQIDGARGDVTDVLLRASVAGDRQPPRYHLTASLQDGGWRSADGAVSLSGLTGDLQANDDDGRFTPAPHCIHD
jgi:Predicted membrane protein